VREQNLPHLAARVERTGLSALWVLVGEHIEAVEEIPFEEGEFTFYVLRLWNATAFRRKMLHEVRFPARGALLAPPWYRFQP
jgi:hypothetical protein